MMAKTKAATAAVMDFTNVQDGVQFQKKRYPEGDYPALITKVQDVKAKSDGVRQWLYTIEVKSGKYPYYCKHEANQYWKVRNLFIAAGINVPKKRVNVDPNKVLNKKIAVTLQDDEYDGRAQSEIASVFPLSELDTSSAPDGDEDEDVEEVPQKKSKSKSVEAPQANGKKAKKNKKAKAKTVDEVTDDELEELEVEDI